MKNLIYLSLLILMSLACKKDKENDKPTTCGVQDPVTELDWLAELKEPCDMSHICLTAIFQGVYEGETVFFGQLQGPLCDPAIYIVLLDCKGDIVKEYPWEDYDDFVEEVDSVETIYSCYE